MFKKKPTIKTLSPLRSSDRRRLADQIIAEFGVEVPEVEEEPAPVPAPAPESVPESAPPAPAPEQPAAKAEIHAASPSPLSLVRARLLPEGTLSGRFITTAGPNLEEIHGTIYVGAHPDEDARILWVKTDRFFPTVYTLWHNPQLIPLLYAPSTAIARLRGGADLMIPGLVGGPPFPEKAKQNSIVAVASIDKPTVPLFVGVCEIDVSALQQVEGVKGHAVRGFHWAGDELSVWRQLGKIDCVEPEYLEGWASSSSEKDTGLEGAIEGVSISDKQAAPATADGETTVDGEAKAGNETQEAANDEIEPPKGLTTKEIDEIFYNAFLYAVHHAKRVNKDDNQNYGIEFPIPQSQVISNLIMPFLPIVHASQASSLQIKKTSWKNVKKFIKHLDKKDLVKSKDRNGGETVILAIDFQNQDITDFYPYKLPKKNDAPASESAKGSNNTNPGALNDPSLSQTLKRIVLYRPKESLKHFFQESNADSPMFYQTSEIRPIIASYIESHNLVSHTNKRFIKLDPILANAVFDGSDPMDTEVLASGQIARDAIMERVLQGCMPFYVILRNDAALSEAKPKPGHGPQIQIIMDKRTGNKAVTRVSGLEAYFINPQRLADELQKTCASSTSVGQLIGASPKHPLMEVMVQGPQSAHIKQALEKRGVKKEWVDVIDKTKKKKK